MEKIARPLLPPEIEVDLNKSSKITINIEEQYLEWGKTYENTIKEYGNSKISDWQKVFVKVDTSRKTGVLIETNFKRKIIPYLIGLTKGKCAFCRKCNVSGRLDDRTVTVEHFKPKSKYPELTYYWGNLFPSCQRCNNRKNDRYEEGKIVEIDDPNYEFDDYFGIDLLTGWVYPSSLEDEKKIAARNFIESYKLNDDGLPALRLDEYKYYFEFFRNLDIENTSIFNKALEKVDFDFFLRRTILNDNKVDQILNKYLDE